MTDFFLSPSSHPVPSLDSTSQNAAPEPHTASALTNGFTGEEEEDYTIKCICGHQEDDGSTVLCETCQTWQHIECYYKSQGIKVPGDDENHYCRDCEPRELNGKIAAERQREKRQAIDVVDPKAKKPVSNKSTKKKTKTPDHGAWPSDKHDTTIHRNGTNGSPREPTHPPKRTKGHRSSHSIQTTVPLKLPASTSRRSTSASHVQSPVKSHGKENSMESEPYSLEFMQLYDNDPGDTQMKGNLFNDIDTANLLGKWSHDADAVNEATNGRSAHEIFVRCDQSVDEMEKATVKKHTKTDESQEYFGRHPTWTYLTVESDTPENMVIGELRGKIGHMNSYVKDEANRWEDLRHPAPFVFFHPHLPIYIDTRREGTVCRYARRSCMPNIHFKTFLEGSDMRFCFFASKDLAAGEELTLAWTPDEHVRNALRDIPQNETLADGGALDYIGDYYSKVLPNFGGCACEDQTKCACTIWSDHRQHETKNSNGKSKKVRKGTHHSTNSSGRTPSSRSGSESKGLQDEEDEDDDQSTSASSRSKPHSRDITPTGGDLKTERERKKLKRDLEAIAALEQGAQVKKQKKRHSGPNDAVPASASRLTFPTGNMDFSSLAHNGYSASMPNTPNVASKPRYADAGTSQTRSKSPTAQSPTSRYPTNKVAIPYSPKTSSPLATYTTSSTQVDLDKVIMAPPKPAFPPRPYVSRTRQLMQRAEKHKLLREKHREESLRLSATPSPAGPESHPAQSPTITTTPAVAEETDVDGDVKMEGADAPPPLADMPLEPTIEKTPCENPTPAEDTTKNSTPGSDTSSAKITAPSPTNGPPKPKDTSIPVNGTRLSPPILHVNLPPPSTFTPSTSTGTPVVAQSPVSQTPVSNTPGASLLPPAPSASLTQPSPAKKKLSLSAWSARNQQKQALKTDLEKEASLKEESSPISKSGSADPLTRPLETLVEEARQAGPGENAIVETPKEEGGDPMAVDTGAL